MFGWEMKQCLRRNDDVHWVVSAGALLHFPAKKATIYSMLGSRSCSLSSTTTRSLCSISLPMIFCIPTELLKHLTSLRLAQEEGKTQYLDKSSARDNNHDQRYTREAQSLAHKTELDDRSRAMLLRKSLNRQVHEQSFVSSHFYHFIVRIGLFPSLLYTS
jgi:hypothetical protein